MSKQGSDGELFALRRCWRRWTAVVELFARRRPGRRRVDPREYELLRLELLRHCQRLGVGEDRRALCEQMANLVEPWLTPRALGHADCEILQDLVLRCRQVADQLGGGSRLLAITGWCVAGLGLLGGAASLVTWWESWDWDSAGQAARAWSASAWAAVRHTSTAQRMFALGTVVALAAILLISRTYSRG
jgi:hypothetical protein